MICNDCNLKRNTVNGAYCILHQRNVEYIHILHCPDYDNDDDI